MQQTTPPTESRLGWATIAVTAVANGTVTGVASYVGAKLGQSTSPSGRPGEAPTAVILPPGVDRQ